jgi:hypothetical protein
VSLALFLPPPTLVHLCLSLTDVHLRSAIVFWIWRTERNGRRKMEDYVRPPVSSLCCNFFQSRP